MQRDRLIQLVAVAVAVVALVGAGLMVPRVSAQRRDLQLTYDVATAEGGKPTYAVLAAGLGSFKGLAVNALWYRAEMEKRAGRYAEANNLAEWITELQPRFPQVWAFHSWNLAYNISVGTYTPQERWDWVHKGITLLRDEGIAFNPNAVQLYRELAWLWFHKVGTYSDDLNWYYKNQVAQEWQELLGGPNDSMTPEGVQRFLDEIAGVADRYLAFQRPEKAIRDALAALAGGSDPVDLVADALQDLQESPVIRLDRRLSAMREALLADGRTAAAEQIDPVLAAVREAVARAERDPVSVFRGDVPAAGAAIDALREAGFGLDAEALRALGRVRLYARYGGPDAAQWMLSLPEAVIGDDGRRMIGLLTENDTPAFAASLEALMPFLRAKVLLQAYHMDPAFMAEVARRYGPADWRHPMAHALYWSALGVEKARDLRNNESVDYINLKRVSIHAIQSLVDFGSVAYNPLLPDGERVDFMPAPEFIDSYGAALEEAMADADSGEFRRNVRMESFASGHENFLHKAIMLNYLYGSEDAAARYYEQLRIEYGDAPHNLRDRRYEQPLSDLVWQFLKDDLDSPSQTTIRYLLDGMLTERAYGNGLVYGRFRIFNQVVVRVKEFYDKYQEERAYETGLDQKGRLELPPFEQVLEDTFTNFMQDPTRDLGSRVAAYRNAPVVLNQRAWPRFIENVRDQVPAGNDATQLFPQPPGTEDPAVSGDKAGSKTIERK
ncbi:hypothetical protein [Phycisphaera mikurensis]|uniref:Uncharacterized protein n=1 Tax=Phycisphaera mikurensis (strain NBRC 102666 / KCTC 22515 / FYK2301M01) TaxID=1142394 RepID=I0IEN7_PHYMF|nr:hypothetical protein [Phycisphaera mikurensis]MBB6441523.1 hypothetical protein [Phycisphaera mikurensis]BAM03725.1 hypothetical protein PSMK_15660 [Phycisphaera mikurensis NBRC 102666]